ncbi:MAG: right-handed parallel beta-helix repeat-containing protein, partial [Thermofilaceae archaeon]
VVERDNIILDGNGHTITGPGSARGILLEYRKNVTIRNFKIENFNTGIYLSVSNGSAVTGNTISNNRYGIHLYRSSGNTVTGNTISNNRYGIYLFMSSGNTVTGNTISNNYYGIYLSVSNGNTVTGNTISNNDYGIYLYDSNNNRIVGNVFSGCGLFVYSSYSNTVEGNTVNGKPLVYLENARDVVVKDAGQVVLVRSERIRVENSNLSNTTVGVQLWQTKDSTIKNNTLANNKYGIYLYDSNNNRIVGNVFSGCGLFVYSSYSNTVEGNTVNGKPLVYLENARDVVVKDAGQVVLVRSERIRVENSNLSNTTVGVQLWESKECKITNSTITNNNDYGIYLYMSSGNTVTGNTISNNYCGIDLYRSSGNTVTGNTISNNYYGIRLSYSNGNTVTGNTITNNDYGIRLYMSSGNTVTGNTISNNYCGIDLSVSNGNTVTGNTISNNYYGIYLYRSSGGRVFLNSFIGNNRQVDSIESKNSWDDGSRGNYWSDYTGEDRNNDGIGDKPYTIDRENVDRYPLIRPYESYFITITSPYGTVRGGGWYAKGSRAVISVSPATIDHGNGTRRVFSEWYDERGSLLSGNSQFSLTVEKPLTATARWDTEYKVEVSSPYGTVRGGGWYAKGSRAVISVSPATIDHGNGTRRVFIGWYDEGGNLLSGEAQFSLTVEKPFKVVAVWKTEYLVQASSPYGTVRGGGWYAKGSLATVSVSPAVVDRDFFIYYVFESWLVDGEVASTSPEYSFTVDQPVTLTASWRSEVKLASIALVAAIVLAISIITLLVLARRRRTTRTERGS